MFSSTRQAILTSVRYPDRHRSKTSGEVHGVLLFTAAEFPRSNERGSIEASVELGRSRHANVVPTFEGTVLKGTCRRASAVPTCERRAHGRMNVAQLKLGDGHHRGHFVG